MTLRRPPRTATHGDEGLALPTVIAMLLVSVMLVTTLAAVTLNTIGSTTSTRAAVQAQAAAEAGLDVARAAIAAGTYQCSYPSAANATPTYVVNVAYDGVTGAPTCAMPVGALDATVPASGALLVSTGTAAKGGLQQQTVGNTRRLRATLTLSSASGGGLPATAVFSGGPVSVQNPSQVLESAAGKADADVYSGGSYSCLNSSEIDGVVRSQGDVSMVNGCSAKAVWAKGTVTLNGSASVAGDIFSASTSTSPAAVNVTGGSPTPRSNVYANGSVSLGDASVGGSVLSTGAGISFRNGSTISGSAYGRLGVDYGGGGSGTILRDAIASRGAISGPTTQNPNEFTWSIGGNASAASCIANSVKVTGSLSPARKLPGQSCSATSSEVSSSLAFPATPNNPAGVAATTMPATVAAPAAQTFPTLTTRVSGVDRFTDWTDAGWNVKTFLPSGGVDSCTKARNYLKDAVTAGTVARAAWNASPLLVVIRACPDSFAFDADNAALFNNGTMALQNDLAIMSDRGVTNQNQIKFASSSSTVRNLYWLVPSDSPVVTTASPPACNSNGNGRLTPNSVTTDATVRWFLFTPCGISTSNSIGSSSSPITGAIIGGSVTVGSSIYLKYSPMSLPGVTGGGGGSPTWSLTDVRDVPSS